MKWRHTIASLFVLVSTAAAANGFNISLSSTPNMDGVTVPEVVIAVDRNVSSLNRSSVQSAIRNTLGSSRVRPDLVELQSVATSALNMASDKYEGVDTICYERWCARVYLAD